MDGLCVETGPSTFLREFNCQKTQCAGAKGGARSGRKGEPGRGVSPGAEIANELEIQDVTAPGPPPGPSLPVLAWPGVLLRSEQGGVCLAI